MSLTDWVKSDRPEPRGRAQKPEGDPRGRLMKMLRRLQNSSRAWNAIIRGELSPPNPTPSSPVGGAVG
jgi:hypothetical protein